MCPDARANPDYRFIHGREAPPTSPRELKAGPVTVLFDGADLRRVRVGGTEVVRRIYTAVRDVNWDTVLPARSGLSVEAGGREFRISYQALHRKEELELTAEITIEGRADGSLRFTFDGVAKSDFPYCRIGICVLHPPEAAGQPFRAESLDRTTEDRLPALVGPQWIKNGTLHALFQPYTRLSIRMADDLEADFRFEGDLFEMEDQRNWTDASFKTYSTPLALGFPHRARAGQRFRQSVEIRLRGDAASRGVSQVPAREVAIAVGNQLRAGLPAIGLGTSSVAATLETREADLLRQLAPDHLRYELHLGEEGAFDGLRAALTACVQLGAGLELALFLGENTQSDFAHAAKALRGAPIRRFLVFKNGDRCSDGTPVQAARAHLRSDHPHAKFLGGTHIYFAELNRTRPDTTAMDGVTFTITPQVHDSDDISVMENVQVQADALRSARALSGEGREVAVSPITLKPRFNPFANRALTQDPNTLPFGVDERQAALFAAAWTVGSLKYLIEGGASALTYYETVGWRGLVETEAGAPMPHLFPSRPGMVFPVYWVFLDLAGWRDSAVLRCDSSDPQRVIGLALRSGARTRTVVANLTADAQDARLSLATSSPEATLSFIDVGSFIPVPPDAASAGRRTLTVHATDGAVRLHLDPYAVICVDGT